MMQGGWHCELLSRHTATMTDRTADLELEVSPAGHMQHASCVIDPAKVAACKARHVCGLNSAVSVQNFHACGSLSSILHEKLQLRFKLEQHVQEPRQHLEPTVC